MDPTTVNVIKAMRGITTEELARRAGVDRATVWRLESGRTRVSDETALRVYRALLDPSPTPAAPAKQP